MFGLQSSLAVRAQWQVCKGVGRAAAWGVSRRRYYPARAFHASRTLQVVKPVLLADIGEGEYPLISWAPYGLYIYITTALTRQQASSNARSYNGSSSPMRESKSSRHYARYRATRPRLRSRAASRVLSRSCTTRREKWPRLGSRSWTSTSKGR